ncbi:hypothetical protein TraAM80_03840 [Trypanosoma rangeli]|uniref:Uncharacterized protein n=1 Tax=Trypanosoma rangeli TaxID=5698 RepID=A0A422NMM1_TRYRA|nr:uncharacterized protein TraAM80_03840 [Trypanosoma rangeli]RNF06644.1 hypothetical protein TraAM80_03840 [Trypanosoma rangeli]|eukprot:RNF06644.1 hypothetical protein TraAM80_03840 [Trypanosoma rangeli]
MDDLIRSETECRNHIVVVENSTAQAQLFYFLRLTGDLIGEVKRSHYINILHAVLKSLPTLCLYARFLERKEAMLAESAGALRSKRDIESLTNSIADLLPTQWVAHSGEKANLPPNLRKACDTFHQEHALFRVQLLATLGLKLARVQKELVFAVHAERIRNCAHLFALFPPRTPIQERGGTPEQNYGLVVSDGCLVPHGG